MAAVWVRLRTFVRPDVCAMAVLLGTGIGVAAELETPEQRFSDVRRASLERRELRIDGRVVPIKLVLLTCDAECHRANVIEVSEVGDICLSWRPVGASSRGGTKGFPAAFALKQPRRDQVFQLARDFAQTKPAMDSLPLPRRLLLAYRDDDGWIEGMFDRAHLSPAFQSFVRELAHTQYLEFGPLVPRLPFDAQFRPGRAPHATTFAATDEGQLLASVQDRQVILFNADLHRLRSVQLPEPLMHPAPIELIGRAAFSPDGKWLAVAVKDERIVVLDANDWSVAANILLQTRLRGIVFTRDSEALVVVSDPLRCFRVGDWTCLDDQVDANIVGLWESPRGDRTLLLLRDGSLRLTDPLRRGAAREQTGVASGILLAERCRHCVSAFSPDGSLVAAILVSASAAATQPESLGRHLKVWQVKDGTLVADLLAFGMPIRSGAALHWLHDGVHLAGFIQPDRGSAFLRSKSLHLWNVLDTRHVAEFIGPSRPVGLASNGRQLFVADYNGKLFRWDLDRHRDSWRPLHCQGD
jgi:hypothetical protein